LRGYGGHIVKVNLSSGRVEVLDTPKDFINCIGGKVYAAKYFYENVNVRDGFDPSNVLLIATGPANGTKVPMASKVGFYFLSPLTGYFGESYMGGDFTAFMKWAGIDAFIIIGKSDKPVYIYAHDSNVEIRDASSIWGLNTHEAEKLIRENIGFEDASIITIGQAGENLVKFACISHNFGSKRRESKAGRMGGGAVMGSKKLKGIAVVSSRKDVDVFDSNELLTIVNDVLTRIYKDPRSGLSNYRRYGTPGSLFYALNAGYFPSHYFTKCGSEFEEEYNPDEIANKFYDHNLACINCPFACGKYVKVKEGEFSGFEGKHAEYETIFAFAGLTEISKYEYVLKINELCDLYGLDTIETGNVIALLLYAIEKGRVKINNYRFGDFNAIIKLIDDIAFRRGLGDKLAEGVKRFSELMGIQDLAIHVKGLSPSGYDPRVLKSMALEFAVNNRGADHLRMTAYAFELTGRLKGMNTREMVRYLVEAEDRMIIFDSMILCRFARFIYEWRDLIRVLKAITGIKYSIDKLRDLANYSRSLIRLFNIDRGLKPEIDDDLHRRFYDEKAVFRGKEYSLSRDEVKRMIEYYYEFRGWDKRGRPIKKK